MASMTAERGVCSSRKVDNNQSLLQCKDTHSAMDAGPGSIQFLRVIERLFQEVNGSAVLF